MNWYTQMPKRQKLLLAVVGVMFFGYLGDMAYRRLYAEPLREATGEAEMLRSDLHDARIAVRGEQNRLEELPKLDQQSLPRNLEIAIHRVPEPLRLAPPPNPTPQLHPPQTLIA